MDFKEENICLIRIFWIFFKSNVVWRRNKNIAKKKCVNANDIFCIYVLECCCCLCFSEEKWNIWRKINKARMWKKYIDRMNRARVREMRIMLVFLTQFLEFVTSSMIYFTTYHFNSFKLKGDLQWTRKLAWMTQVQLIMSEL